MTRLYAARVVARLRRELCMDVELVGAPYGQFKVEVDGRVVLEAGPLAALGVLPSAQKVLDAVRTQLSRDAGAT